MLDETSVRHHVVLVLSDLGSGGAQRVALALARHWLDGGRRVALVTLSGPEQDFFDPPVGATRIVIGGVSKSRGLLSGGFANLRRIAALRQALIAAAAPVAVAFVAPMAILSVLATMGTGIRLIAAERNDPARQSFGRVWDALRRWIYPWASLVTANTEGAVKTLQAFVPASRLAFTPNPLPMPTAGAAAADGPLVLTVARLHQQKGIDVLLDAVARAGATLAGWRVVLVGDGPAREVLTDRCRRLGLLERVSFVGAVPDPTPWLRSPAIFVLPSRFEGMPNALLEAMTHGRPVIVSDASSGPLQWVSDGDTGLVVPVGDAEALAAALSRLAVNPALARRLGEAAATRMATARSRDDAIARWEEALGWRV